MGGDYLHIYFNLITTFNLLIMSEKDFQTSNRQFGVVLNAELKRHALSLLQCCLVSAISSATLFMPSEWRRFLSFELLPGNHVGFR